MRKTTPNLCHERVDDIPLLWGVLQQLRLPELLEQHLGGHHLHQGLPNGTLATVWLAYILSEADHRKASVQDWARRHQHLLQHLLQQPLRPVEFTDDRLGILLRRLHQANWNDLEQQLWDNTCEIYEIPFDGIRLDSTTSYGYHQVTPEGLMQFGHSKDHRPDLPQLKLMAAVAQPTSHTIASQIHCGQRADDELYLPLMDRVRQQLQRTGLLYLGDCKMAAAATRADIVAHQDYYLTVLPRTGSNAASIDAWIEAALTGKQALHEFVRVNAKKEREVFATAYETTRSCEVVVGEQVVRWSERVQLVRTPALAEHHGGQLERRLQAAATALQALTPAVGRGHRQHRDEASLCAAIAATLTEYDVVDLLTVTYHREEYGAGSRGKSSEGWPGSRAGVPEAKVRYVVDGVLRNEAGIEGAKARYGWRVQVTNLPEKKCDLENAILLYNGGWSGERPFHLLKDRPLGIQPFYVREEDQIDGLTRLLMIGLRVLTLLEVQVRARLSARGESLVGLYEGQGSRKTSSPTGRRLLGAVSRMEITATCLSDEVGKPWVLTPLPPLLLQILSLLNLTPDLYTSLITAGE